MRMSTIQAATQMRRRHLLALFNSGYLHKNNYMVVAQFSTKMLRIRPIPILKFGRMATSILGLNGRQTNQFGYTKIVRNSSSIASSSPALDLQNEATAKDEEFPVEKEEVKIDEMEQQQEKQVGETKNNSAGKQQIGGQKMFGRKIYPRQNGQRDLKVHYEMGKSGHKFIEINMGFGPTTFDFPNIHVPDDIFGFVRAMDEVLESVHAKKSIIIEASNKRQEKPVLHTAKATGLYYDYQLELYVLNKIVCVQMRTLPHGPEHKPRYQFLPLHQFHWMRHAIVELFAANGEEDIQQQLGKPPGYPAWLNRDSIHFAVLSNNRQQSIAAQPPQSQPQMQSQQQQALLQQLLQLVLQQQQQLQQMQAANAQRNNNLGFGVVPQGSDQIILMSDLLAQQQQQKMHNNQLDDGIGNLLAQFQQPIASTTKNNNQLTNLVNLLLQNISGHQNW